MSRFPSRVEPKRDRSAKDRDRECRIAPASDERAKATDVERRIESEADSVDPIDSGTLELVEAPLDDGVRSRALDARPDTRCSGCRSDHGPAIGSEEAGP
jgi:hypothetical protein